MPDYHRGRARDRYYDDDYDNDDTYYTEPERRPAPTKHRSLSRRAKDKLEDKLEDAMGKLGLAESGSNNSNALVHRRHRSPTPGPVSAGALARRHRSSDHHHSDSHHDSHHRHRSHSHAHSHAHSHKSGSSSGRHHGHSHGHHRRHHDDDYYDDKHRSRRGYSAFPTRHPHRHSGVYSSSHRDRSRSRDRGRTKSTSSGNRHRSLSRWDRSLKSAVDAAALEAFRLRKEPGGWTSAKKTSRIATAAISAAAIGSAMDDKHPGKEKRGELGTIGSAIGGLLVNRVVNGSRKDNRRYD
ncbi:hypothetical protein V8F06_011173 [Rhypophila decipiens]